MIDLFKYLKSGLSSGLPTDRIGDNANTDTLADAFVFLKPHLKRHWFSFLSGLFIVALATAVGFAPPLLTRFLVDDVILAKQLELLAAVAALLAACVIFDKLMGLVEKLYFARLEQCLVLDIQNELLSRLLRLPKAFFDSQQTGYLTSRISKDVESLRWLFSSTSVKILINLLRLAGGLSFLLYLHWQLALVTLLVLPLLVALLRLFSKRIYVLAHQQLETKADADAQLQQNLAATSLTKAFSNEEKAQRSILSSFSTNLKSSIEQVSVSSFAELLINLMPSIARGIAMVGGAVLIVQDQWTLGGLLAFMAYLGFVFGPAQYLATANLQFQKALAALNRVASLTTVVPEENTDSGLDIDMLSGDIQFQHVNFAYDGRNPVLENINLHVRPAQRVAIVGPSGVGKTTLISLLLIFYKENDGTIIFDGYCTNEYNIGSLRRRIGYASQQPQLINGTIMENLLYGDSDASAQRVDKAANAAGVHDFVKTLPQGYETILGDNGLSLSEGQKQRLSMARALIADPDILILDEPTASLDNITELSIIEAMEHLFEGKTVIIVTHSQAVVEKCDSVILLDKLGRATQGTHEELIQTNTLYQEMFEKPSNIDKTINNYHESTKILKHEIDNTNVIPN